MAGRFAKIIKGPCRDHEKRNEIRGLGRWVPNDGQFAKTSLKFVVM